MSLVIRNAQPEDVEEMIAIEHICFPPAEAADAQSICERYAAFPENFFVAELDGSVVVSSTAAPPTSQRCPTNCIMTYRCTNPTVLIRPCSGWMCCLLTAIRASLPSFCSA